MTGLLSRHGRPSDLRGRNRPDRAMGVLGSVVDRYLSLVTTLDYTGAVGAADADRQVDLLVAERAPATADGDVVRLTLRAPDGAELPARPDRKSVV